MAPAGQLASPAVPLTFSRTAEVQAPVQLTTEIAGTSVLASVPPNATVKPVVPAPLTVAVPAPVIAVIAVCRFALEIAVPPAPNTAVVVPLTRSWKDCVAVNEPSVTCWDSLPPTIAARMPAAVLFCPRTIGTLFAPL